MRSLSVVESIKFRKFANACEMQDDSFDCGIACVLTIYKYFSNRSLNPEIVKEYCETSYSGTRLSKIVEALDDLGMSTEAYQLESKSEFKNIKKISLLHVKNAKRQNHYVLLYRISDKEALIHDPAKGLHFIDLEELDNIWESKVFITIDSSLNTIKGNLGKSELNMMWLRSFVPSNIYTNLFVALTLGIIVVVIGLSLNLLMQLSIDDIIPNSDRNRLTTLTLGLCLAMLGRIAIEGFRIFLINVSARELSVKLYSNFVEKLINLRTKFFLTRKIGDIIARVNDSNRLQGLVTSITTTIVIDLLTVIFSIISISLYSPIIGFYILLLVPIFILLVIYGTSKLNLKLNDVMEAGSKYESELIDLLSGVPQLKYAGKESLFTESVLRRFSELQNKQFSLNMKTLRYSLKLEVLILFFVVPVFYFSSLLVFQENIHLGAMVAIVSFTGLMFPAILRLGNFKIKLKESKVALKRISSIIHLTSEHDLTRNYVQVPARFESLEISRVTFKFNDQKKLIENLDFNLNCGEIIHIGGDSGQGKSSIFNLILSNFDPVAGEIKINNININEIRVSDLREFIGIVPQEIKIFNNSLIYNICLDEDIEQHRRVVDFCNDLGFNEYFESLPSGYESHLGEDGVKVSGGQRQIIGLARCLFRKPKIVLLDEATSFVDFGIERFIHGLLKKMSDNAGIVMITHKVPDMSFYNASYLMSNGKLIRS